MKLLVRPGRTEPPCQPFDLQPARTRGVVGACPWPGDKARLQSPNAPPPPGALLQETSWVYWITWPPALGAPGGWTPLPSPAARAGRGLAGAGLCGEPGCTGLTPPQARRPSFSPGIGEAARPPGEPPLPGPVPQGAPGLLFILKAMGGARAPTKHGVLGARTEGSLFPSHFTQNNHCTMCPSLQFPAPWAAGSTDRREDEPRRCWVGADLHLLRRAACSCPPPHTHAPLHVVKVWKRLLSTHPALPKKIYFQESGQSGGGGAVAHTHPLINLPRNP